MFDLLILGQPSLDINKDFGGQTLRNIGGAVVYSGYSAASTGANVAVAPKCNLHEIDLEGLFAASKGVTVFPLDSAHSTSIENIYLSADRERRKCRAISKIDPYRAEELPPVQARIIHIAGLMWGDLGEDIIQYAADNAQAAVDVQCLLRRAVDGAMVFEDWPGKIKYLPMIRYLKTDAAEAEILTGLTDREAAAVQLHEWGAGEVMITHNTQALVYDGHNMYTSPLKPRNLTGRTGRGDTIFAAYLCERLKGDIQAALTYSAALVSLKMETPGPFTGGRADVEAYLDAFY